MNGMATGLSNCITKDGQTTVTNDIPLGGNKITGLGTPTATTDASTMGYVDTTAAATQYAGTVTAATVGSDITIATALNNGDTLDGVTLATDDIVLVKDQSDASENGLYTVAATPARNTLYDAYDDHPGAIITVQEGTANANTGWICTSTVGGTIDTTDIDFASLSTATTKTGTIDTNPDATNDTIAFYDDSAGVGKQALMAYLPGAILGILSHRSASDQNAATDSWVTRALDTEDYDRLSILSLSSNQFTISAAGTYEIYYEGQFLTETLGIHAIRLYDITGAAELDVGMAGCGGSFSGTSSNISACSHPSGHTVVTITASNTFEIQGYVEDNSSDNEFGRGSSVGDTYNTQLTRVVIRRA